MYKSFGISCLAAVAGAAVTPTNLIGSFVESRAAPSDACNFFKAAFPDKTLFPSDALYKNETQESWSAVAWLQPACVFTPSSPQDVQTAIRHLSALKTQFAIRGGGHMPIADAANINSTGVLISTTKLNEIKLSSDKTYVSVRPGNRWANVYEVIDPYGLVVVGGRMGVVGVPGFVLGGGISFFSYEHGFASNNVRAFECVLADGRLVEARANNEFSDLFWALKGGGNNYCFVTRLDLLTYSAPKITVGMENYGVGVKDKFLDAVYDWAIDGSKDVKSAITPILNYGPALLGPNPIYQAMLFYNGADTAPKALENFTAPNFTPVRSTWSTRSLLEWTHETDEPFHTNPLAVGQRQKFYVVSFTIDRELIGKIHDIYLDGVLNQLANVTNLITGLAYNVVTNNYIAVSNKGGSPMGIDETKGPYVWLEESISWTNAADDAKIEAFIKSINVAIEGEVRARGLQSPYLYLNDADKGQPVFQGYGAANVKKLQEIRNKYDAGLVFTNLVPGGFKVAHV